MKKFDVFAISAAMFALLVVVAEQAHPSVRAMPPVQANRAPHPAPEQPLPYSHKTHVRLGLTCQLCHSSPSPGIQMTFPATSICMNCHATVVTDRPSIQKLALYSASEQPIPWVRVYKVLPGVTWTHRKHVEAGVQCETCHGAVGELGSMSETTAVTAMASCISCHQVRGVSTACTVCHEWPRE